MIRVNGQLRKKIKLLKSLGIQPAIAVRLIEVGKDPDAKLSDYVEVVSLCAALSSKLLAFANSSWFSPRYPITTIDRALTMIGTKQVQAMSISFCLGERSVNRI